MATIIRLLIYKGPAEELATLRMQPDGDRRMSAENSLCEQPYIKAVHGPNSTLRILTLTNTTQRFRRLRAIAAALFTRHDTRVADVTAKLADERSAALAERERAIEHILRSVNRSFTPLALSRVLDGAKVDQGGSSSGA